MMASEAEVMLELRRVLPATRREVFEAWTRPEVLTTWCAPGPMSTPSAQVDLREGGRFRLEMRAPDGTSHVAVGTYQAIVQDERLVFSWRWEGPDAAESLVTIELHARGAETELVLRHARLPSTASRDQHRQGWMGCLDKLQGLLDQGIAGRAAARQGGAAHPG